MTACAALLLVLFVQQAPAPSASALTETAVIDLVQRAPSFGPASQREDLAVAYMALIPETQERGYFAEIRWREGVKFRGALVSLVRSDVELPDGMEWVVRHERWGIVAIEYGKTWQDMVNELQAAANASFETSVISRLKTFASGQKLFASFVGGAYAGDMACLLKPTACGIATETGLVDESFQQAERSGYRFTLHAGAVRSTEQGHALVKTYAYTAEPLSGGAPNRRAFCIDQSGRLCAVGPATPLDIKNAACPASCAPVK